MVASESFVEFLREQLNPAGRITFRRMFGTTGVFCDGLMIGLVSDDVFYMRVDDLNRDLFVEAGAGAPYTYVKQGETVPLAFLRAPESILDESSEFLALTRESLAAAGRIASRRQKRSPSRSRAKRTPS
jgi:DNA transformation protein